MSGCRRFPTTDWCVVAYITESLAVRGRAAFARSSFLKEAYVSGEGWCHKTSFCSVIRFPAGYLIGDPRWAKERPVEGGLHIYCASVRQAGRSPARGREGGRLGVLALDWTCQKGTRTPTISSLTSPQGRHSMRKIVFPLHCGKSRGQAHRRSQGGSDQSQALKFSLDIPSPPRTDPFHQRFPFWI